MQVVSYVFEGAKDNNLDLVQLSRNFPEIAKGSILIQRNTFFGIYLSNSCK